MPAATPLPSTPAPAWPELLPHRAHLVRYARRRLQDAALAEDLVHDVFLAVATGRARFDGRSALRTWLVGILKHKIVDLVRLRAAWCPLEDDADDGVATLESPQAPPDEVAAQRQRLRGTLQRIGALPDTLRSAVELRLLHDEDSSTVCRRLGITPINLSVRLHRARQLLAA